MFTCSEHSRVLSQFMISIKAARLNVSLYPPLCQEKLETIMGLWCACPQIFMILDFRCVCRMLVSCICVCVHVKVEVSGEGNMKCMYKPGLNCIFVCCQWFLFVLSDCQWVRFTKRTII